MLGRLIARSALQSFNRSQTQAEQYRQANPPDPDAKPSIAGLVIFLLTLPIAIAGFEQGMAGHITLGVCVEYVVAILGLMLIAGVVHAVSQSRGAHKVQKIIKQRYSDFKPSRGTPPPARTKAVVDKPEDLETERKRRVTDLMRVPCDECKSPVRWPCRMTGNYAIVQKNPPLFIHLSRMSAGLAAETVDYDELIAQFGSPAK